MGKNIDNKLSKNTIYNTVKTVFNILFPLISFPYIARVLGVDNVGKINYSSSIVSYFSLIASLGIFTYAVRECSKYRDDKKSLSNVASQILSINICTTLVSYFFLAVTLLIVHKFNNYRDLIIIQSLAILFSTLGADWLNTAMEDLKYISIRTILMQVVSLLCMFIFVKKSDDYVVYSIIVVLANSGANIINILYRRKYCKIRFTFKIDWKSHMIPIITLFSMMIFQTINTNADTTMLGLIKGDTSVGLYSTSVRIYNAVNQVVASIAWVLMPRLAHSFQQRDYDIVNRLLRYALNHIIVLGVPAIIGINVVTKELIAVFAGPEYVPAVGSLRILTISLALSFFGGLVGNMILLPSNKEKIFLYGCIINTTLNFLLNMVVIPLWGEKGAALSTVISQLAFLTYAICHVDKEIQIKNVTKMLVGPLIGGMAILFISIIVKAVFSSNLIILLVTVASSAIVYMVVLLLTQDEYIYSYIRLIKKSRKDLAN